ncbi:MAG: RNA-binding S4 domain-containing protein [Verrucomicrobiales bacterium]|nr:RNA-binding S4 domain-containing protein [Verrucomicrobiales bacterium]
MELANGVRIDKWLWAVRLYKTRALAAAACRGGLVEIAGIKVKPARTVHIGEAIVTRLGDITRTTRVLGLVQRRVGAQTVRELAEDLTPASEYTKKRAPSLNAPPLRPKGMGRPTKKDRRAMEKFLWT